MTNNSSINNNNRQNILKYVESNVNNMLELYR
ncbi:hypothetical protein bsdtw1_00611 [Clostridium fungisolvens]|uniref:Uncharacterized protein n=1 Tax=Clostridium fungisolvens TaxID=1604897 RepID=A0A6V8SCY5_9CLOT|nr:hypothetical protein bsdtw1_00611 [Clostridium fungisolvens]